MINDTQVEQTETLENLQQDTQQVEQPTETQHAKQTAETDKEKNLRQLREKSERVERERDDAVRMLQEMQSKAKVQPIEDDESFGINDNDLVEGKHLAKFNKKIQRLEQTIKEQQAQTREIALEAQIKAQYPDFDSVVSKDNIDVLRSQYPEIAQTLNTSPDLYSKAVSAYTLIKKLGIIPDDQTLLNHQAVQRNVAKPRPLASIAPQEGDSPLSHANAFANGLTPDLQKKLWSEMNAARKQS